MRRPFALVLFVPAVLAAALTFSPVANAAAQRTFVASDGLTANTAFNCSIAKPCRQFSEAIGVTISGGEVIVLDSAGYGPVTITQSVSIIAPPGVYAGISVFSGNGITINGGGISVLLRGLTIKGQGGNNGIFIQSASEVHVESCIVSGMAGGGIVMNGAAAMLVKDSIARDNGLNGIFNNGFATVERSRSERNGQSGYFSTNGATVISDSTFSQNVLNGISVEALGALNNKVSVDRSVIHGNREDGVLVNGPGARLTMAKSMVEANGKGGVNVKQGSRANLFDTVVTRNGTISPSAGLLTSDSGTIVLLENTRITDHQANGVVVGASTAVMTRGNNTLANNTPDDVSPPASLTPIAPN